MITSLNLKWPECQNYKEHGGQTSGNLSALWVGLIELVPLVSISDLLLGRQKRQDVGQDPIGKSQTH